MPLLAGKDYIMNQNEGKTKSISIRATEKDHTTISKMAEQQGISVSAFLIKKAIGREADNYQNKKTKDSIMNLSNNICMLRDACRRYNNTQSPYVLEQILGWTDAVVEGMENVWQSLR